MAQRPLLLTLLWLTFMGSATAADPFAPIPESREAELQRLEALVAELAPQVEAVAGRRFHRIPEVVLATPKMLSEVLYAEQVHLLRRVSNLTEQEAQLHAQVSSSDLSGAFVGKYGLIDKKLYVMPAGISAALATRGVPQGLTGPVTELVLAHELTHALQDQHTDLASVVASRSGSDGVVAVNCTVEGHAVWIHERVGALRGYTTAVAVVAQILGYDLAQPGISDNPSTFYTSYVYGQGRNFVDAQVAAHGPEAVWQILSSPPAATSMIVQPSRYSPDTVYAWSRPVRESVARARRRISPRSWKPTHEAVGDYNLRERLARSGNGHSLADNFLAGWSSRSHNSPVEWVEIQLLGFDDDYAAADYVERMKIQAEVNLEMHLPALTSAVTRAPGIDGSVAVFQPMAGDDAAAEERIRNELGIGPAHEFRQVWVARDTFVVQVTIMNHETSDRRLTRAIKRVFRAVH